MSHPQPPQRQPTQSETIDYAKALHNVSILLVVACPLLALVPPRKFDAYTIGLAGTTVYSANYLAKERTGKSLWQNVRGNTSSVTAPVAVQSQEESDVQRALREQRTEDLLAQQKNQHSVVGEVEKVGGWREQREKEVEEALEEGKGIMDMVTDQIWEVWNWGKPKDEDED